MIEILQKLIEHVKDHYSNENVEGVHVQIIEVTQDYKKYSVGIMLPKGTQWLEVKQTND